jgi:hypothetical protein
MNRHHFIVATTTIQSLNETNRGASTGTTIWRATRNNTLELKAPPKAVLMLHHSLFRMNSHAQ